MNKLHGDVRTQEGIQGVQGLIISAYLILSNSSGPEDVFPLGSVETGGDGRFTLSFEMPDGERTANIIVGVTGPEQHTNAISDVVAPIAGALDRDFLFITAPRAVSANGSESFSIRIANEKLAKAGVVLPETTTTGSRLLLRTERLLEEIGTTEHAVGMAIGERVRSERTLEREFDTQYFPKFTDEIRGKVSAHNPQYKFVVNNSEDGAPAVLSRLAIQSGIEAIQGERLRPVPLGRTAAGGRRRTRFFFSTTEFNDLDAATTENGAVPADGYKLIGDAALKSILGMDRRLDEHGMPTELNREEVLFDAFQNETVEEECAREFLGEGASGGAGTPPPGEPEPPEPADEESVLKKLTLVTQDIDSPLKTLTGRDGAPGVVQSIQDFAIPVGPADEPRIFDFSTLQVAFQDAWQSVLDQRIEPLARALYTRTNKVLSVNAFERAELDSYRGIKKAYNTVHSATSGSTTGVLFRRNDGRGPAASFEDSVGAVLPDPIDPRDIPPGPVGPDRPLAPDHAVVVPVPDDGGQADPNARPEDLIDQLDAILREPYEFTAFGADNRSKAMNFGLLIGYRHVMTPVTYQVGDLVKSITLTPGESREYTTKTVLTRKRAEKELAKNSSIRRDELNDTSRAETEIVRKAMAKTNYSLTSEGTYNLGFTKGDVTTKAGRDAETNSNDVKKSFREAVLKASEEVRQERSIDISLEESETFEGTAKGKLENTNNELTLTYLFFELQRRFRVNETIQKATPVILVAQNVPAPNEVTNAFLIEHAWILKRALLDDTFEEPLDYVCTSLVGDRLEVKALAQTLADHRRQVHELKTQLVALEEQAGRRYQALVQAVKERLAEETSEESDGFFSDLGESLFGGGETTGTARLREEAARDAEQRAAQKAKELATILQRGVNALNEATEAYNRANRRYNNMLLQVAKLRVHVKQNIIHYMQVIWAHEVDDQRFLRLYQTPVPQFAAIPNEETLFRRLHEKSSVTRVHVTDSDLDDDGPSKKAELRIGVDFEILPSVEMLPKDLERPLVEVADLTKLLGFLGNYMIFPMKESNALTDLMLNPYLDEGFRLLDPHDPGNITRPQFADYICKLRKQLSEEDFDEIKGALKARYRELLLSSEYTGDEIVVPSGALYIEAITGAKPLLENFKLAHRAFDLVGAQEEARQKTLENLRFAARIVEGEYGDPETDARYDFFGAPGVVAPTEGGGGTDGGGGE